MACSPLSTVGLVRFDFTNAANVDSHAFHRLDLHFIERKSMRKGKQLRQSRLFDSEAVEGSIFFHLFQKAAVDQLLGRDLGRARISARYFVERRLNGTGLDVELRLQDFQLLSVSRIENLSIGEADLLGHQPES